MNSRRLCFAGFAILIFGPTLFAQSQTKFPAYVASIKPSAGDTRGFWITPGRFRARDMPARVLVAIGYGLQPTQITGGPGWIDSERFDVDATLDDEKADEGQEGLMIKAILAERFRLILHEDKEEASIYALVITPKGSQLKPSADGTPLSMRFGASSMIGANVPLGLFASLIGSRLGRNIIDRTSLEGRYDIELHWTPDAAASSDPVNAANGDSSGPSIFTAIQEQLGLKLQSTKGPSGFLVVDRMERPPAN